MLGEWSPPGLGNLSNGRRLSISMRRPNNRGAGANFILEEGDTMNEADWQLLLDHLATLPGMMGAELTEGTSVSRTVVPDVDYVPLPPINDA